MTHLLVGWLVDACTFSGDLSVASDCQTLVSTYLLHLLDCQWQDYDFTLISDLQLPEFLIHTAVSKFNAVSIFHYLHPPSFSMQKSGLNVKEG